jgi:hypothetical protein
MKKIVVVSLLGLFLVGCGAMKGLEAASNRSKLEKLDIGMTTYEVQELMGRAYKREAYEGHEIWFYRTEWTPRPEQEMTPLVFENGKLVGWGSRYIDENLKKYELRIR